MPYPTIRKLDGTGKELKRIKNWQNEVTQQPMTATEYFIYSSVLGKLVSEVGQTGEKIKTFVTANGMTVAEQERQIFNNMAETVTFYHQDASGASLQQTNPAGNPVVFGSVSEFDATGNNVGNVNPYLQGGSGGNEGGSSTDFSQSPFGEIDSQGNPRLRQKKERDGVSVPDSYFNNLLNSGLVGGKFGLLEYNVRMSMPKYIGVGINLKDGKQNNIRIGSPSDEGKFADVARRTGTTLHRFFLVNDSWGIDLAIVSQGQSLKPNNFNLSKFYDFIPSSNNFTKVAFKNNTNALTEFLNQILSYGKCEEMVNKLLQEYGRLIGGTNKLVAGTIRGVFEKVMESNGFVVNLNLEGVFNHYQLPRYLSSYGEYYRKLGKTKDYVDQQTALYKEDWLEKKRNLGGLTDFQNGGIRIYIVGGFGFYNDSPRSAMYIARNAARTFVHELFHAAFNSKINDGGDFDHAKWKEATNNLAGVDFYDYLRIYCGLDNGK